MNRRSFLGLTGTILLAPALVRASNLDYVPYERLFAHQVENYSREHGYVEQGKYHSLERHFSTFRVTDQFGRDRGWLDKQENYIGMNWRQKRIHARENLRDLIVKTDDFGPAIPLKTLMA